MSQRAESNKGRARFYRLPVLIGVAGTGLSLLASWLANSAHTTEFVSDFRTNAWATVSTMRSELHAYVAILRGGAALFAASEQVTDEEFRRYVDRLMIAENYPGFQGIGFSMRVRPGQLPYALARVKGLGIDNPRLLEEEPGHETHMIVQLHPLDARNRAALGFNMFSEAARREAMTQARDRGLPAVTGPVILKQEIDPEKQHGFLIYVPVYESGLIPPADLRKEQLEGFVYAPFRGGDFLARTVGDPTNGEISYEVFDTEVGPGRVLHRSTARPSPRSTLERTVPVDVEGRTWMVRFRPTEIFLDRHGASPVWWVLPLCLMLTATMVVLATSEGRSRKAAVIELEERLRTEQELALSERRFRTMMEESPLSIQVFDPQGKFLDANAAFRNLWGISPEQLKGYSILDDPKFENEGLKGHLLSAFQGNVVAMPACYYGPEEAGGRGRWVTMLAYPLKGPDGAVQEVVLVQQDITVQKHAEETIRSVNANLEARVQERTAQLAQSVAEMESFSYTVAHDLRAPLRAMGGYSRMLEEDFGEGLNDAGREYLARIRENSYRMGSMIDALLDLARISRIEIHREAVDLSALSHEILDSLARRSPERSVETKVMQKMIAEGDERLLHLVLQNLLENAWKFTSKLEHAHIEVGCYMEPEGDVFFVRDNGAGYDPDHHRKLFGPFERLHTPEEFPGSGVGLATVKRIIERHGGKVWAEGALGKGATFYFQLPPLVAAG